MPPTSLKAGASHAVLTDPSSLAWAFNIRGSDVPHTPLALGFAILAADGAHSVFIDKRKLPIATEAYLTQLSTLRPPSAFEPDLIALAGAGARVALDPVLAAERLRQLVADNGGVVVEATDPARMPRATKNAAEIDGSRAGAPAGRRGGAKMLAWLDRQEPGSIDEITAVEKLEAFRRLVGEETQMPLRDISFETISGAGPNGAIMHYRVTRATNRVLADGELFLIDFGGQYQRNDRHHAHGPRRNASPEMRQRFTLVLKGMIAISLPRFPEGTRGSDLDPLARIALWKAGADFAHGTGHGVGSYLSVHEGPQRISKTGVQKLLPGMILSNEPGYYREGAFGIRIENLVHVPRAIARERRPAMHGFETLTLLPVDQRDAGDRPADARRVGLAQCLSRRVRERSVRCSTAKRWSGWNRRQRRCRTTARAE